MITSSPLLLPHKSTPFRELPTAIGIYEKILRVETRATLDEADENAVLARVVGYFLLEFYTRRDILCGGPLAKVIDDIAP